ncbi:hypothetical protein ACFL3I_02155 [Pseudomonadota bacterium]
MNINIQKLCDFLLDDLKSQPVLSLLEEFIVNRTSTAGVSREEVFTREFLCPSIARYYYEVNRAKLDLSDDEIKSGLGTEGFQNCPGFGFTPAQSRTQLFTKSDVIKVTPPDSWFKASEKPLSAFQPCPDFAISDPLPISVIGEVKYFTKGSPKLAVKELYNAARQAMFYLGAFQDSYEAALLVVADASPDHSFIRGLELVRPELLERFGPKSNVYLAPVGLQ